MSLVGESEVGSSELEGVGDAEVVSAGGAATVNVVSQAATAHFSAPCGVAAIDKVEPSASSATVNENFVSAAPFAVIPGTVQVSFVPSKASPAAASFAGSAIDVCARGSPRSLMTSAPAGRSTAPVLLTVSVIPTSAPGATVAPVAGSEASATVQVGSAALSLLVRSVPAVSAGVAWLTPVNDRVATSVIDATIAPRARALPNATRRCIPVLTM